MTNPLMDQGRAVKKIEDFLDVLKDAGSLDLQSNILACNGHVQLSPEATLSADAPVLADSPDSPLICVEFTGRDTSLLLARNGELLHAIEHIAAKILRLEPEEHDLIFFDAEGFKANRDRELRASAEVAVKQVRATDRPYSFPPMTSRERRMLHLALAKSGLPTASSGEGPRRFVILYPDGPIPTKTESPPTAERLRAIQSSFRRR
jgi:spoIIIJ-associated protein